MKIETFKNELRKQINANKKHFKTEELMVLVDFICILAEEDFDNKEID